MTFIKPCRNQSFYNDVLLYLHIYTYFRSKFLNKQFHIAMIPPKNVLVPYAICHAGCISERGMEGSFFPLSLPTNPQQDRKQSAYVLDCWGSGRLEAGQEGKYLELKFSLVLSLSYIIQFSLPGQNTLRVLSIYLYASLAIKFAHRKKKKSNVATKTA